MSPDRDLDFLQLETQTLETAQTTNHLLHDSLNKHQLSLLSMPLPAFEVVNNIPSLASAENEGEYCNEVERAQIRYNHPIHHRLLRI